MKSVKSSLHFMLNSGGIKNQTTFGYFFWCQLSTRYRSHTKKFTQWGLSAFCLLLKPQSLHEKWVKLTLSGRVPRSQGELLGPELSKEWARWESRWRQSPPAKTLEAAICKSPAISLGWVTFYYRSFLSHCLHICTLNDYVFNDYLYIQNVLLRFSSNDQHQVMRKRAIG